jgi:hypothetical protein
MAQVGSHTTSKDGRSEPDTSSVATWWANLTDRSDLTGLSTQERALREKELAEERQAIYEAEQGLPSSTSILVRL